MERSTGFGILLAVAVLAVLALGCNKDAAAEAHQIADGHSGHGESEAKGPAVKGFDGMPPVGTKAVCPVMKNEFVVNETTESSVHEGKTYVFCCPGCKEQFEADPKKFL